MRRLMLIVVLLVALSACNTQRSAVVSTADESEEQTFSDVYSARRDTSSVLIQAEIDSPVIVVIHADSTQLHMRARRLRLNSQRADCTTRSEEVHTDSAARQTSNANVSEHRETDTSPDWMEWLVYAAIIIYIVNRIRTKLTGKN